MATPAPIKPLDPSDDSSNSQDLRPPLTLVGSSSTPSEPVIRRLALDRLRELHDDGVTTDYIGRMYGLSGDEVREIETELRRDERRRSRSSDSPDGW